MPLFYRTIPKLDQKLGAKPVLIGLVSRWLTSFPLLPILSTLNCFQDDRRAAIGTGVDSRTAVVGAGVRPEWPAPDARDQHSGHVPSHHRGHHLQVPHDDRAYPDSVVDPNAILADPRHSQRRPEWSASSAARERQDEVDGGVTSTPHSRWFYAFTSFICWRSTQRRPQLQDVPCTMIFLTF